MVNKRKKTYVPDKGDVVWVDLDPTKGKEQAKVRPALILSPREYNEKTNLAIVCPVTSVKKNYPFEVLINDPKVSGVILSDHVRSFDWQFRKTRLITRLKPKVLREVLTKLGVLLGA